MYHSIHFSLRCLISGMIPRMDISSLWRWGRGRSTFCDTSQELTLLQTTLLLESKYGQCEGQCHIHAYGWQLDHTPTVDDLDMHLWSMAKYLFEAVDFMHQHGVAHVGFMHQHGVAHLDLKPPNTAIPMKGGCLSIIDFNKSVHVSGVEETFCGVIGTVRYFAPKVAANHGLYSTILSLIACSGRCCSYRGQQPGVPIPTATLIFLFCGSLDLSQDSYYLHDWIHTVYTCVSTIHLFC